MARKIGEMKMSLSVLNTQYWTERAASYGQQHLSELRNPNTENHIFEIIYLTRDQKQLY